jgi:hypothetical protein
MTNGIEGTNPRAKHEPGADRQWRGGLPRNDSMFLNQAGRVIRIDGARRNVVPLAIDLDRRQDVNRNVRILRGREARRGK